jgi:hypothetical protein
MIWTHAPANNPTHDPTINTPCVRAMVIVGCTVGILSGTAQGPPALMVCDAAACHVVIVCCRVEGCEAHLWGTG